MTTDEELALVTAAISAIEEIISTVRSASGGSISPSDALDAITRLHAQLAANNAAADAALAKKFDTGGS